MAGAVSGVPGAGYPNRTDIAAQPVRAAGGQPYGRRGAQEAAQRAVPLPQARELPTPLHAPSQRPDEPVTAGIPVGPGRNSMSVQAGRPIPPGSADDVLMALQDAYRLFPSDEIMDMLIAETMRRGG